jgi:hypothetical protein
LCITVPLHLSKSAIILMYEDLQFHLIYIFNSSKGRRGRDRMVVGFPTTCAINVYHHYGCEFEPCSLGGVLDTIEPVLRCCLSYNATFLSQR